MPFPALPTAALLTLLALATTARAEEAAAPPAPRAPSGPGAPVPSPPEVDVPPPLPGQERMPPGSPEDQRLWKDSGDLGNRLTSARYVGASLHWKIKAEDLHARLEAAARAQPAQASRLEEIRKAMLYAQTESYADLAGRWPIDKTRACQYQRGIFGSSLEAATDRDNRGQLAQARDATTRCLEIGLSTLARVQRTNDELARAIEVAEKALAPTPAPATGT